MTRYFKKKKLKEIPYLDLKLTNAESGTENYFIYIYFL